MAEDKNSYKSPYYADLIASVEGKLGLPSGLLYNVVTKGERSNADQVSSAKAQTVFQIIPETRQRFLDRDGIDAYVSPENAALVAGKILKESLDRNRGSAKEAVGEFIGGTNRANWGPTTKSYINRVMTGVAGAAAPSAIATGKPRSLTRELAQQPATAQPSIAKIYEAYQSGAMPADVAAEFEADVTAGKVLLPRNAALKNAPPQTVEKIQIPASVMAAYNSGAMPEDVRAELDADLKSGRAIPITAAMIPGQTPEGAQTTPESSASILDRVRGVAETGLNVATGLTGGALGMAGGALGGLAGAIMNGDFGTPQGTRNIEQAATEGAQALTYQPRTETGQQYSQAVGETLASAIPVMPLTAEIGMAARGAGAALPAVQAAGAAGVARAIPAAKQAVAAVRAAPERVANAVRPSAQPTPGTRGSVGSAGVDKAQLRQALADELPVPIKLTEGQKTRSFEQQRFEQETAKNPEVGGPLRENAATQNEAMIANFDSFVDQTGAMETTARGTGSSVDAALQSRLAADKAQIRIAYKNAEKAGEMEAPVQLGKVIDHLNDQAPEMAAGVSTTLQAARNRAIRLGAAVEDAEGQLIAQPIPLKSAELFRRAISSATDFDPVNIRQSSIMKGLIDEATDGVGGSLYKDARKLRSRLSQNYENTTLIKQLVGKKRGTTDRVVALEDVFDRSIIRGSLDDVRQLRRVLQTEGEQGQQAWKELRGATIRHIRDAATSNVARDIRGNEIVSAAKLDRVIRQLDADGKLDFIFGKKGGEQLRVINDLAKDVYTSPPGSVNTSNTASVLMAAMDMAISGTAGLPLPVLSGIKLLSKNVKDRALRKRVEEALANTKKKPIAGQGSEL